MVVVVTTDNPGDLRIVEVIGLVSGTAVRSLALSEDLRKDLEAAHAEAVSTLSLSALEKGADYVVGLRFSESMAHDRMIIHAYGTAVKVMRSSGGS